MNHDDITASPILGLVVQQALERGAYRPEQEWLLRELLATVAWTEQLSDPDERAFWIMAAISLLANRS